MAQGGRRKDGVLRVATRKIDSDRRFEVKELIYPSTYHAMKAGPCRVGVCKHEGECGKCEEYGLLRMYAARDTDRIHELRALVKELSNIAERFVSCKATYCEIACGDIKEKCINKKTIELVAKAREAIGGAK